MKTRQKRTSPPASVVPDAPLSPQWAFVVQFRAAPGGPAYTAGRVEHLVSGQAVRFHSLEALLAFMIQVLTDVQTP